MSRKEPRAHRHHHLDRQIEEVVHDPYQARAKPPEPSACPNCGIVFHQGRWQRLPRPTDARDHICPACHRTHDHFPAGYVTLSGEAMTSRREELMRLVRHEETKEKSDHPLHRIMEIEDQPDKIVITTTDVHLPRRIGEAVRRAFRGDLDVKYSPDEYTVRVNWTG
jgi:NMD protein affecting ribosome stability and mRNA decay